MNENGKQLAIWGAVLQLGGVVGLLGTVIGMLGTFAEVSQSSMGQSETVASGIRGSLCAAIGGAAISLVGTVLLLVALFSARYRAPWFRVLLWVLSVIWLFSFPIGTVLGVVVIVYLVKHKEEFTVLS